MQNIPDYSQILQLTQTPEGKKLISMLQSVDTQTLTTAMNHARAGNFDDARQTLSALLSTPEAQDLLKKLGGSHGGNGR